MGLNYSLVGVNNTVPEAIVRHPCLAYDDYDVNGKREIEYPIRQFVIFSPDVGNSHYYKNELCNFEFEISCMICDQIGLCHGTTMSIRVQTTNIVIWTLEEGVQYRRI